MSNTPRAIRLVPTSGVIIAGLVISTACSAADRKAADIPSTSSTTAMQVTGPRFTTADFAHLRWLDGNWRGRLPDGKPFYESYRAMNDSTIHMGAFSDTTYRTQTDSASIRLRGGVIVHQGNGAPFNATRVDSSVADFGSSTVASNHFTWTRLSADRWRADLFMPSQSGAEQKVVYQMERVKRK